MPNDRPIRSFVAVGDSFTEGLNDELPDGSMAGWADRLAATLAGRSGPAGFRYANLAVRGRLLDAIVAEQLPLAVVAAPDLVSFSAGGNDVLRPGFDPDDAAARYERALVRLRSTGARVLVFAGFDPGRTPVLRLARGRIAIYNELLRGIAARHGCDLVWARAHLLPWVRRHLRGRSSGDGLAPKRPGLELFPPVEAD